MSESSLREAIARALYEHHAAGLGGRGAHSWEEIVEGGENRPYPEYPHLADEFRARADAVLAVLADPPADVTERATNAVHTSLLDECGAGSSLLYCAPEADSDGFLEVQGAVDLPHLVRDVLRAAFGGEQA